MYEYSARDVQPTEETQPPQSKRRNVVCIELQCGVGGCVALLRIHTLMAADKEPHEEAPEVVALGTAHSIRCGKGHSQGGLPRNGMAFSAAVDKEWGYD